MVVISTVIYRNWRTSRGHRQSHTCIVYKWKYLRMYISGWNLIGNHVACQIASIPMTLKVILAVWNLSNSHTPENIAHISLCVHTWIGKCKWPVISTVVHKKASIRWQDNQWARRRLVTQWRHGCHAMKRSVCNAGASNGVGPFAFR